MCNAESHDLHSPSNTTSKMRLAGTVALTGDRRNARSVLVGKHEGKITLGRPRHRYMLKNWDRRGKSRFIWLRKETGGWFFEQNNEPVVSIQCGEFLEQLRN